MRISHFEQLKPICPACRRVGRETQLVLGGDAVEDQFGISSGLLHCQEIECRRSYPIIDGMPVLVPDLDAWLAANGHLILQRGFLPDGVEDILGRAMGPNAAFNVVRQQLSSYAFDHYGDLDPGHRDGPLALEPGAVQRCLAAALAPLPAACGPILDIGCAVGRTSFDLATASQELVLGIDLNWPLIRMARTVLEGGAARYPHRVNGLNYVRRNLPAHFPGADRVDFWVADALCLPFSPHRFDLAVAMNVLDCVTDPKSLLLEIFRALREGGGMALATPFDWAEHATHLSAWLENVDAFRALLAHASEVSRQCGGGGFIEAGPFQEFEWQVRLHNRASMRYGTCIASGSIGK